MGYISIPTDLTGYIQTNTGTYTGNDTANRAIPHNLGKIPKYVHIIVDANGYACFILINGSLTYLDQLNDSVLSVTNMDSTNFYVGNAGSYNLSMNNSPTVYSWIAFG